MKQQHKRNYKRLSVAVLGRIQGSWDLATVAERTEGLIWYQRSHAYAEDLATRYRGYGVTTSQAAAVISALSPGLSWELNVGQAETMIRAYHVDKARGADLPTLGVYGRAAVKKCAEILKGVEPDLLFKERTGPKTRAFYQCILDPWEPRAVVIDRHAASAALGTRGERGGSTSNVVRPALYRWLVWHYRTVAQRVGVTPAQLQAVVWVAWRLDRLILAMGYRWSGGLL